MMDLKGLAWIGNIYDKFEAMCLEMEEVMYEVDVLTCGDYKLSFLF